MKDMTSMLNSLYANHSNLQFVKHIELMIKLYMYESIVYMLQNVQNNVFRNGIRSVSFKI